MAHVPRTAFNGTLLIDATKWKDILFDLAPGAGRHLKTPRQGISEVLTEVFDGLGQHAKALGLDADLRTGLQQKTETITSLRALHESAKKLTEVIGESIALLEDEREADLSSIAENVRRTMARKDPSIGAAFEKLLAYVSAVALKAAATRRKNEAADTEESGNEPR